jgi:zinc transporter ZupT
MTDLAVLATGFGVISLAAIMLYSVGGRVLQSREATWGLLLGVIGFLGLSHAMAAVLLNHSLFGDSVLATTIPFVGLVVGAGIAWILLEGPFIQKEPNRILVAAVVFVGLHSFGDGLVLGATFIGGIVPTVRVDAVTVTATVVHRFLEGCLVVVPALAASWKPWPAFVALLASLLAIPAAFVPGLIFNAYAQPVRAEIQLAVPTFFAAIEATLGLWLLVRAFLPMASANRGSRWPVWTTIGFVLISVVHFFVE